MNNVDMSTGEWSTHGWTSSCEAEDGADRQIEVTIFEKMGVHLKFTTKHPGEEAPLMTDLRLSWVGLSLLLLCIDPLIDGTFTKFAHTQRPEAKTS